MNAAEFLREIRQELEEVIDEMVKLEVQASSAPRRGEIEGGKEDFEKITTQWKKLYGNVGDSAKLLQEDKRKTKIVYKLGTNKLAEKRISDTDLLLHGFHLFMSEKEGKKISPPVLPDALSAMMLTNKDIITMQSWLIKQKEKSDESIRACEKLKRRLKELLAEKKRMKIENKALLIHATNLEEEVNELPNEEKISTMRQEIKDLKEKICALNDEHSESLSAKETLNYNVQLELKKRNEFMESTTEKLRHIKNDTTELQKFRENLANNSYSLASNQFCMFVELLSVVWKLKSLLERLSQILEARSNNLVQLKGDVAVLIRCGEEMKMHVEGSSSANQALQKELDSLYENASCVEKTVSGMHNKTVDLLEKATTASATVMSDFDLDEYKQEKDVQYKNANDEFIKAAKDLERLELTLKSFELEVRDSVRVSSHDYVSSTWNTNRESLLWEEKVLSLLSTAQKLEDMVVEAKEQVGEEKKDIIESTMEILNKSDIFSGIEKGVRYSMSTTIMLSDSTKEHEYTLTGKDHFTNDVLKDQ